jgi:hypothetical protein
MYSFLSIFATTPNGHFEEITAKHDAQMNQKQKRATGLIRLLSLFLIPFCNVKRKLLLSLSNHPNISFVAMNNIDGHNKHPTPV